MFALPYLSSSLAFFVCVYTPVEQAGMSYQKQRGATKQLVLGSKARLTEEDVAQL